MIFDAFPEPIDLVILATPLMRYLDFRGPEGTNFGIKSSVLKNFLESNNIKIKEGSDEEISRSELSKSIADGTIFLSCWMTQEQIKKLKSQKVMFKDIINN